MSKSTTDTSNLRHTSMMSKSTQASAPEDVIKKLLSLELDRNDKLEAGISYLLSIRASDLQNDAKKYLLESRKILDPLLKVFIGDEHYKPWVRYFDVAYKVSGDYYDDNNDDEDAFATAMDTLVEEVLLPSVGGKARNVDWRVVKKILSIKQTFQKNQLLEIDPLSLLKPLQDQLRKALDYLIWKDQNDCTILTRKTIKKLLSILDDGSQTEKIKNAMISGRFDRNQFGLENTAILGEDGGMYLLLNRVGSYQRKVLEDELGEKYLQDKVKEKKSSKNLANTKKEMGDRIEIGKGSFGIVRFALSLLETEAKPGDLICVKKSRSFEAIRQEGGNDIILSAIDIVTGTTLEDYFTSSMAKVVYAPKIYDMALVVNKNLTDSHHLKGYLMMEVLPRNTGGRIFQLPEYQKWEYQKPYLLDVFRGNISLLSMKVAMTDLKPDNTLYDTDLRKATIIDLGGTVKVESYQHLDSFDIEKYSIQRTPAFTAKELMADKGVINLHKAISYSCGKLALSVLSCTDYEDKEKKLKELIGGLCAENADDRPTLEEAVNILMQIGDDSYQQRTIFTNYISKVKQRIENNKSSISLNEDIFHTRDVYITQEATTLDPYKYGNQKSEDLQAKIDAFFEAEANAEKQVFLLLGAAGSGKSIVLQLKFVEAVNSWKVGDPLPIYFNLANGIELPDILSKLNQELKTDLSLDKNLKNQRVHLYIDSFDEGMGTGFERRATLLQSYIEQLDSSSAHKILISCRSDYLQSDSDDIWFTPKSPDGILQPNKLEKCFVAPITYNDRTKLEKNIRKYFDNKNTRGDASNEKNYTVDDYLRKINQMNLVEIIDTGFMFYMVMETLSSIQGNNIGRCAIYHQFLQNYIANESKLLIKERQEKIAQSLQGFDGLDFYTNLAKSIASELHLSGTVRISKESPLFKMLDYSHSRVFKYQLISYVLRILPFKIEIKAMQTDKEQDSVMESITIGFKHDILKNYYLMESIRDELGKANSSKILASRSIVADVQLLRLIAESIQRDKSGLWQKSLMKAVNDSKTDKSATSVVSAANAITLLTMVKHPFSNVDLTNISIEGANLRNGWFECTDFGGADLSRVNLTNTKLMGANLERAIMTEVNLSVFPDLLGHTDYVNSVSYSPDGKTIATASDDKTVKIWDATTGSQLSDLRGHTESVRSVSYSPDRKTIATASADHTVKIWDAATSSQLSDLQGHTGAVNSVSYSPDGTTIATASEDETAKIWDAATGNQLSDLQGHFMAVMSVGYSPDGKTIVTASEDSTVRIWDATTGSELSILLGHTDSVKSASYSPDGKTIVTASDDKTVRIWDAATGTQLSDLEGHTKAVNSAIYSPDGKTIAIASDDQTVKIWDAATGSQLSDLQGHTYSVNSVSYSPDGKTIATASKDKTVKIWDVATGSQLSYLQGHTGTVKSVSFSPDGKTIATASKDQTAKIWDVAAGSQLSDFRGHTGTVNSVSYSPDGKTIATASKDQTAKIWDAATGSQLSDLRGHTGAVMSVSYSPDGKTIATASKDKTVKIWDVATSSQLSDFRGHTDTVNSVSYSPDGKTIATASTDRTAKIWDVATGSQLSHLRGHTGTVNSVCYSPDGKTIATASDDYIVKMWDVATGSKLSDIQGHTDQVRSVSYSPDGKTIATSSLDATVRIWDAATGSQLSDLKGHTHYMINSVSYSPDGKTIATASYDITVKIAAQVNDKWVIIREISASEGSLTADQAIIDGAINLSEQNKRVLQQRGCAADQPKNNETFKARNTVQGEMLGLEIEEKDKIMLIEGKSKIKEISNVQATVEGEVLGLERDEKDKNRLIEVRPKSKETPKERTTFCCEIF